MVDVLKLLDHYGLLDEKALVTQNSIAISCPFHDETQGSFHAYLESGDFHCFGCGFHGDARAFVKAIDTSVDDDLQALAAIVKCGANVDGGFEFKRGHNSGGVEVAQVFWNQLPEVDWQSIPGGLIRPRDYLTKRGLHPLTLNEFDIRMNISSTHPIVTPVMQQGEFKGYISRRDDDGEPKYLNNPGFNKIETIGGAWCKGPLFVVEGMFDMMRMWQNGARNIVCIFGWHMSNEQAEQLKDFASPAICALDNDERGEDGYDRLKVVFENLLKFEYDSVDPGKMKHEEFVRAYKKLGV